MGPSEIILFRKYKEGVPNHVLIFLESMYIVHVVEEIEMSRKVIPALRDWTRSLGSLTDS